MNEERSIRLLEQLESRAAALLGDLRESRLQQDALATRCGELEARLVELEAIRRELAEENRELEEQNRELEAHNHRLLEREPVEASTPLFHRQARRAQGLSALIGHRPRQPDAGETASEPPATHEKPAPAALQPPQADPEPAVEAKPAGEASSEEVPSPQALLDQWYQRYASTFFKGHTRPLKVGIHAELAAREPWPEKLVRRALACYVNLPRYLKSVREGAERLDLAGEPAGRVDAAAAEHARKKLERLQADRRQKGRPARPRGKGRDPAKADKPSHAASRPAGERVDSSRPDPAPAPPGGAGETATPGREPATLEEKLSALLAKHTPR
ncbi:ProQ/FINO family protein [Halomonas ventosae]|uniref:ProP effector n=2 Tax=Halomonas TaxID=2745 RepID=A0A4R6H7J3_9GAMM|nr:ProQ/FINO family protein [Halomonas ventosae]TDO03506.1 ProP effector [Halomonas ventosae]